MAALTLGPQEVDRIIIQMMRMAEYLDWDVSELRPVGSSSCMSLLILPPSQSFICPPHFRQAAFIPSARMARLSVLGAVEVRGYSPQKSTSLPSLLRFFKR